MRNQKMFDRLKSAIDKSKNGSPSYKADEENYWQLEGDKAKNGSAVIRFLPGKTDDNDPFVKFYKHGFQGPTSKWFIENCPTTIGGDCPACKENGVLWNSGSKADKEIVSKRKRKTTYISNILVISDSKHPENEGKVFLFKYGPKIFAKIEDAFNPKFEDEVAINPFDPVEGANFKLKMCQVEGYANFDKSSFAAVEAIGDQKYIDSVVAQMHDLDQFLDPAQYKSYEDLEKRLNGVLDASGGSRRTAAPVDADGDGEYVEKAVKAAAKPAPAKRAEPIDADDDDDMMAEFQRLADD